MVEISIASNQQPNFPWQLFAKVVCLDSMADAQLEDGSRDPQKIDFSMFVGDPKRLIQLYSVGEEAPLGYTVIEWIGQVAGNIHVGFLPPARGKMARACVMYAIHVAFQLRPELMKLRAEIPAYNRAASQMAFWCGMRREGRFTQTFLKNGQLFDTILFGVTRNEFFKQHLWLGAEGANSSRNIH